MEYTKRLLDEIGIGGDRLEMYNMSAGEGPKFAQAADEMTARIKQLGPSPVRLRRERRQAEASQT